MKLIVLESPYAGNIKRNEAYARICMHDCLVNHNEAPYASHLLYTQPYVLRDEVPEERALGINAGFAFKEIISHSVFYTDLGWSSGMKLARDLCHKHKFEFVERTLPPVLMGKFTSLATSLGVL